MNALIPVGLVLEATDTATLDKLATVQQVLMRAEQIGLQTEHILHGGMYARTIRLPWNEQIAADGGVLLTGALIKRATVLIINGPTRVLVNDGWFESDGYQVLAAKAGRKQAFVTRGTVELTMIFPTTARTVEEAEAEFTDEADLLLSRRQPGGDLVIITGE